MRRSDSRLRSPLIPGLVLGLATALLAGSPAAADGQTLADYDYDQLTFRGVALGGGYLWSDRIEDTEHYTVRLDLGYLGPGVRIAPAISYWSSEVAGPEIEALAAQLGQRTGTTIDPARLGPIEWSDLSLSVDGQFVWSTPLGILTYIGTGLGLHALNGQGPAVDDTFVEDLLDDITVGVNGIVGVELETSDRLRVFLEGRYTAMNSLRFGAIRGGVQLMFSRGNVQVGAVAAPPVEAP
ncbi:MAG: hypothetical protein R3314_08525 [Longimicrobiales bacterium]|nr:hypothetical protein [Longimicrobiales bacterium]